jgi:hypothetical protein
MFLQTTLAILLCIQEVPGLNLNPDTSYPDWISCAFPQSFQYIKIDTTSSFHILSNS